MLISGWPTKLPKKHAEQKKMPERKESANIACGLLAYTRSQKIYREEHRFLDLCSVLKTVFLEALKFFSPNLKSIYEICSHLSKIDYIFWKETIAEWLACWSFNLIPWFETRFFAHKITFHKNLWTTQNTYDLISRLYTSFFNLTKGVTFSKNLKNSKKLTFQPKF